VLGGGNNLGRKWEAVAWALTAITEIIGEGFNWGLLTEE